jgi:hydrogenase expression/formation protein HypC
MCLGIPGEVIEILPEHPDLARVDVSGVGWTMRSHWPSSQM